MKLFSTRVHGILDYLMGGLLIASPWLFGFNEGGAETWVPVLLGISVLVYSMLTRYEYGVFKTLSMKTHLTLDIIGGIFLAASPWIFGFNEYVYLPHLILGISEIAAATMTEKEVGTLPANHRRHTYRTHTHRTAH